MQRITNTSPERPYKPGLPTGPYVYFCSFLGRPVADHPSPGDDVQGLLATSPTLASLLEQGVALIEDPANPLPRTKKVWMPSDESVALIANLLQQHPDVQETIASR